LKKITPASSIPAREKKKERTHGKKKKGSPESQPHGCLPTRKKGIGKKSPKKRKGGFLVILEGGRRGDDSGEETGDKLSVGAQSCEMKKKKKKKEQHHPKEKGRAKIFYASKTKDREIYKKKSFS